MRRDAVPVNEVDTLILWVILSKVCVSIRYLARAWATLNSKTELNV